MTADYPEPDNYATHKFVTYRNHVPGYPSDIYVYCERCGCEDRGDPAEFPELSYPACDRVDG